MKKMKFVFLALFVMLAGSASLQAALTYSPPSPRTGETVTFTLSPSGSPAGAISWNFGDGSPVQSGTNLTITHVYAAVGSYTASASYFTMTHAQVDQATVMVTNPRQIGFSPPQPKAGQAISFTAQNFFSACIRWDFGDGTVKNGAANESHTYANAGSYTVRAYEECGNTYDTTVIVTVAVGIPRQIGFSPPQPKAGQAIAFTAQNFFSACIRWDFGDGTVKNGAANESHTYANAGSYTVRAYEECGNTYGAEVMVKVTKKDEEPPPVTPEKSTLAVAFVSLYFAGGKADVSVAKDFVGLQALADIKVTGSGILQWQWLVDGMTVKADTMAVSFSNKFSLDSGKVPGLPTAVPGRHQVTLRIQNPKTDFTIPAISYFVGLRGPAPVIRRITPSILAPGKEYKLELEGAELTPGTEISFPAPLAIVKKANILSPTRAQLVVFVAPTAVGGTKLITVKNEYGESNGPGQVTIAVPKPAKASKSSKPKPQPGPNPPQSNSIIFSSPTGGETWVTGKTHSIKYRLTILAMDYQLCLLRNGKFIGYIMFYNNFQQTGYPPGEYTYPWQVGKVMMEDEVPFWAPIGSGYTICAGCCGSGAPPYGLSNEFTISYDFSGLIKKMEKIGLFRLPQPGGCPECFVLDLEGLGGELIKIDETIGAGLYWKGKPMADLGKFGKGQGFAAKLQIKLGPETLAAVKRGDKFELRLFDGAGKQIHSQLTQLVLPPDPNPPPQSSGPPTTSPKPNPPLQANVPKPPNPAPPAVFCADIAVTGIKATLVSTQLGEPTVEFANDTVRLEITIENVGSKGVPSDFIMDLFVRRNGEKVFGQGYPIWSTTLGAPGSRFVISDITDSFPHGLKTTYSVEVLPLASECSTANNQASFDIDETQLHPGGTPDLTLSIFMVEKRWQQEGDQFKGTCYFSADVSNIGSGYCGDGSRTVDLEFIRVAGNRILAFIRIPESELPGPGSKKRFSVEVPDSQEPPGVTPVVAFINPAHNETKKTNNWATNGATLNNDLESPLKSMARISFPTWGMNGRILRVRLEIHNLKQQPLQNLRLILLKNGEQIKEWRSVALAGGGSSGNSHYYYVDERPEIEPSTAKDEYKVILTTNNDNGLPPDNTIMDSQIRPLKWMDLVNSLVQELLRDPEDGIKAQMEKQDKNIRIYSEKTKTKISPESFYIYIEGKKKKLGTWHEFQASVWLKVHARNGQIAADVIDKKLTLGSEAEKILIAIFLPGIGYGIQHGIEKSFISAIPNDLGIGGLPVSPCGIVLRDGALYLYHPYSN